MTDNRGRSRLRFGGDRGAGHWAGAAVAGLLLLAGCVSAGPQEGTADDDTQPAEVVTEAERAEREATEEQQPEAEDEAANDVDAGPAGEVAPDEPGDGADAGTADAIEPLGVGAEPAHLHIPSIGVDEDLIDLGLQPDGSMEVPSDWQRAGWFTGGGRPGGRGPTVIAGHVDSLTGPAVFSDLTELEVGDRVEVTDVDGTVHHYRIYRVEDLPKDDFPTAEVYGALTSDELRLITCTGEFDHTELRHADNRVVFAEVQEV